MVVVVFFFSSRRRHTRCGRDWSSDVCSSDLTISGPPTAAISHSHSTAKILTGSPRSSASPSPTTRPASRSEERRVGKECRNRWWANPYKKHYTKDGLLEIVQPQSQFDTT